MSVPMACHTTPPGHPRPVAMRQHDRLENRGIRISAVASLRVSPRPNPHAEGSSTLAKFHNGRKHASTAQSAAVVLAGSAYFALIRSRGSPVQRSRHTRRRFQRCAPEGCDRPLNLVPRVVEAVIGGPQLLPLAYGNPRRTATDRGPCLPASGGEVGAVDSIGACLCTQAVWQEALNRAGQFPQRGQPLMK